jgi:BirA family biotin operon repressor/biotin-[acetyl-CoA-carboxylase] ligase
LRAAYLERCDTIGRQVKVTLPGGKLMTGIAAGVDEFGCLQVRPAGAAGLAAVSAGDVIHLR